MMNDELFDSCTLVGRLTGNKFTKTTKKGDAMYKSTVMIDRTWKDQNGKRHDSSYGVPFVAYRNPAKVLSDYAAKGSLVLIKGHHSMNAYTDKNGIKRYPLVVVADMVHLLESKKTTEARRQNTNSGNNQPEQSKNSNPFD